MLKWVVKGSPAPKGSCTPEVYRKYIDHDLQSLNARSEGYLTDASSSIVSDPDFVDDHDIDDGVELNEVDDSLSVLEDDIDGSLGDRNNNNSIENLNEISYMDAKFRANYIRGSDPLQQTVRGKHQSRKQKLTAQINRELKLRAGAENLHRATGNKRLRENVALELRLVNSNLQLLKEELAELNSSVDIYQHDKSSQCVPMIPLGLKETNEVHLTLPMSKFLVDHYKEDASDYQHQISKFLELRQASRTPIRNEDGIELLFNYYNHLYFIERRFFPADKGLGVYFEWYDALTGVPCSQRTVGFEKGAVLFNIGALYTQIGAKQDRTQLEGIETAMESFKKAAGAFKYLQENFSNAPSMDMQEHTLDMLAQLMLAQCQECAIERALLRGIGDGMQTHINFAQEAAMVAQMYRDVHRLMSMLPLKDYVPYTWITMVDVKSHYFHALAHLYVSLAVWDQHDSDDVEMLAEHFPVLHIHESSKASPRATVASEIPQNRDERKAFAKAHLRQSILCNEEALRVHGLSKQLRKIDTFLDVLKKAHDRSWQKFSELEDEDDFSELLSAPHVKGRTKELVACTMPDFSSYKVEDLFHALGPLAIFSANHSWTSPQRIDLIRQDGEEYGFSVRGEAPIIIAIVEEDSLAARHGIKVGDFLVGIGDLDIKWQKHDEVVSIIKASGNHLTLKVMTPMDRSYLEPCQQSLSESSSSSAPEDNKEETTSSPPSKSLSPHSLFKKRLKSPKKTSGSHESSSIWTLKKKKGKSPKAVSNNNCEAS